MQQINPGLALLPLKKNSNLLPILSGPSFSTEFNLLCNYLAIPQFASKPAKVHAYLQTTKQFNELKFHPFVHSHLQKSQIWIDSHDIKSFDVLQVDWFFNKHTKYFSQKQLLDEAQQILPTQLHQHIEINVFTLQYYKENKIYTRAFVLEMDKAISREHSRKIFKNLMSVTT